VNSGFDGIIATNTTLNRDAVAGHLHEQESGGLSGRPLTTPSVRIVSQLRGIVPTKMTLVGVGGITDPQDAQAMLAAGANALQIYTSFIYQGTKVVRKLVEASR